jgi:hypothetical protein
VVEHLPSKCEALTSNPSTTKEKTRVGQQWLTPVILATQEAEIQRIEIRSQPMPIVPETLFGLYLKISNTKKGWWSGLRYKPCVQTQVPKEKRDTKDTI